MWFIQGPDDIDLSLQICLQRYHFSVGRILRVRNEGEDDTRKLRVELQQSAKSIHDGLLLNMHVVGGLLAAL